MSIQPSSSSFSPIGSKYAGDLSKAAPKEPKELKTSEITKLAVLLQREKVSIGDDYDMAIKKVARQYVHVRDPSMQKVTREELVGLYKEAVDALYAVHSQVNKKTMINPFMNTSLASASFAETAVSFTEYVLDGKALDPVTKTTLSHLEPEIALFQEAYDRLKASEAKMEKLSDRLVNRLQSKEVIHLENVVIGGGDAATEYWLDMQKSEHTSTNKLLNNNINALPDTLFLAKDTGNWKHDYTLAQTFSLLERGDAPSNPQDFAKASKYEENRHVNARFLFQSNIVNLSETEAPVALGTQVLSIDKKDLHESDWKVDIAPLRAKVKMKVKENTKEVAVELDPRSIEKMYDSLNVKGIDPKVFSEKLITKVLTNSIDNEIRKLGIGGDVTALERAEFSKKNIEALPINDKIKLLSSDLITKLAKDRDSFQEIANDLGIDPSITQYQFSQSLQIFARDIASATLNKEEKMDFEHFLTNCQIDMPYEDFVDGLIKQSISYIDTYNNKITESNNEIVKLKDEIVKTSTKDRLKIDELEKKIKLAEDELKILESKVNPLNTIKSKLLDNSKSAEEKLKIFSHDQLTDLANDKQFSQNLLKKTVSAEKFSKEFKHFIEKHKSDATKIDNRYHDYSIQMDSMDIPKISNGKLTVVTKSYINKHVYANEMNVCAGFGEARKISTDPWFQKNSSGNITGIVTPTQMKKSEMDVLSRFDPNLGFTPVIDGNTFMLTDREENPLKPRDIIIYGGGGNATACYRKAFFSKDSNTEMKSYDTKTQNPKSLTWFAREGFELAGYGKLAHDALTFARDNDQICGGDLVHVEPKGDGSGRVIVYMKDAVGTYQQKEVVYSKEREINSPTKDIYFEDTAPDGTVYTKKMTVRKFECDQFIYTIGQEGTPVKGLFTEFNLDKNTEVTTDPVSKMPLGVKTKDNSLTFWGAAALVASPSSKATVEGRKKNLLEVENETMAAKAKAQESLKTAVTEEEIANAEFENLKAELLDYKIDTYKKRLDVTIEKSGRNAADWINEFDNNLRDWIVLQRIARDAEWPGVMPPSRVSSRQAEFLKRTDLQKNLTELIDRAKVARLNETTAKEDVSRVRKKIKDFSLKTKDNQVLTKDEINHLKTELKVESDIAISKRKNAIEKSIKAQGKLAEAQKGFESINVNLDDIEYINSFLLVAGVGDSKTRVNFITDLLKEREEAYKAESFPGVKAENLQDLIRKYNLGDLVEAKGRSSLVLKSKKQ